MAQQGTPLPAALHLRVAGLQRSDCTARCSLRFRLAGPQRSLRLHCPLRSIFDSPARSVPIALPAARSVCAPIALPAARSVFDSPARSAPIALLNSLCPRETHRPMEGRLRQPGILETPAP